MTNKAFLLFTVFFLGVVNLSIAQLATNEKPYSYNNALPLQAPSLAIQYSDILTTHPEVQQKHKLQKSGVVLDANIHFSDNGSLQYLPSEEAYLWQHRIKAENAHGISLYFSQFQLSENAKLFVYTPDYQYTHGGYTFVNNQKHMQFATSYLPGDELVLECLIPADEIQKVDFTLSGIGYLFKDVPEYESYKFQRDFGDSGPCHVNVNCQEGNNKDGLASAVVRILIRSNSDLFWCSGVTINANQNECDPLILSADHCAADARPQDYNQWIFYFNYEAVGCDNPSNEGILASQSLQGCRKLAKTESSGDEDSDMLLVRLYDDIPATYFPVYIGWDRRDRTADSTFCIHHPAGDIKKISSVSAPTASFSWGGVVSNTHWEVRWRETENGHGITEGGSSGSPLFNKWGFVVGTLTGGSSSCDNPMSPDYFGKLSHHWDKNGTADSLKLQPWLDPQNTGIEVLDGRAGCWALSSESVKPEANTYKLYPNPAKNHIQIDMPASFKASYAIFDVSGKKMDGGSTNADKIVVHVGNYPKGVYIMQITENEKTTTLKWTKQ